MRIVIATFSFPDLANGYYDGRFVLAEARGYALNGASVLVITPHYPGAALRETLHDGIRIRRIRYFWPERWQRVKVPGKPIYRLRSPLAVVQVPLLLGAMVIALLRAASDADLIHAQWTLTALLALPAKWLRAVKLVVTARGSDLRLLPSWLNRWIHRRVDAAIDCFGPQPWNEAYKRAHPARYLKLPLLVDTGDPLAEAPELAPLRALPEPPLIVLYIGRFDRIKLEQNRLPLLTLIEAAALCTQRGVSLKVFYLGHGEPEILAEMRSRIERNHLEDIVSLLGPRMDVTPYVRACDLGIGGIAFNGVVQDFAVAAKPQVFIAGPDNVGTPWLDGETALVLPPADPAALAARLGWAAECRDKLRNIGLRATVAVEEMIRDTVAGGSRYLAAFKTLLASAN